MTNFDEYKNRLTIEGLADILFRTIYCDICPMCNKCKHRTPVCKIKLMYWLESEYTGEQWEFEVF